MIFYLGVHKPWHAAMLPRAFMSVNVLRRRRKPVNCPDVIVDSGAFTELAQYGRYRHSVADYAADLRRLASVVTIKAAVAQDYMCEPFMLAKTGLELADHQRLTIERYDDLLAERLPFPIMAVLQGYEPADYVRHLEAYGDRLELGQWVGVGSVCKRNGHPRQVLAVLEAIARRRPDLRLHGFGIKKTALEHEGVRALLFSADSMAWSYSARRQGRNPNDAAEAVAYGAAIESVLARPSQPWQPSLI
jgi:hypothetical protein